MYVSEQHKFVYFAPTKVGSVTISNLLMRFYGAIGFRPLDMGANDEDIADPKWPPMVHHSVFLPKKYEHYFKFASVRNPYARELSKYNFLSQKAGIISAYDVISKLSFEKYIDWVCTEGLTGFWRLDMWKRTLKDLIFRQPVRKDCVPITEIDAVIKCENMEEDFLSLPFVKEPIHEDVYKLLRGRTNFCTNRRQEVFPTSLVDKCYSHFKEDFEKFGYRKDDVPEACEDIRPHFMFGHGVGPHLTASTDLKDIFGGSIFLL